MKTSIRLALTSLAVCGLTFAASGAPLPFMPKAQPVIATLDAPLPPADAGAATGLDFAAMSFNPN